MKPHFIIYVHCRYLLYTNIRISYINVKVIIYGASGLEVSAQAYLQLKCKYALLLAAYLSGLTDPEHALMWPMGGPLFENAVFAELYRSFLHRGEQAHVYFWRTAAGHEVDFVLDLGTEIIPVEVKLNATPTPQLARNLQDFISLFKNRVGQAMLVCLSNHETQLSEKVTAIPFALL